MGKIVLLPVTVPDSNFCWDGHHVCENFDNDGGYGQCLLSIGAVARNEDGVYPQPSKCLYLETQT